jgi:hypothetical protein
MSSRASEIFEKCENGENIIFIPSIVHSPEYGGTERSS